MKQSDLEFLLKLEDAESNNHKRLLQSLEQKKQDLITKRDEMNHAFLSENPDIQSANYTRFRAIENQRINQDIQKLDTDIEAAKELIRDSVRTDKKYNILKQEIIDTAKKKKEQFQETQADEYTIFKYSKR